MNGEDISLLLFTVREPKHELPARIQALEQLARLERKDLLSRLRELWQRRKPSTFRSPINWDSDAAERVVDLYVILAVYKSGDASLLPEIGARVAKAGNVLKGPDDERRNAAKVIRAIGRPEPIQQLITLSGGQFPETVANAVRTLQMLDLPAPASGGLVGQFPELVSPVSFTIHSLREEIETIAALSSDRIILSREVQRRIASKDYDRGEVKRQDTSLAEILTQEIDMLDLTYAVTGRGVAIYTFEEAGQRWRQWWLDNSSRLVWDPAKRSWRL